MRCFKVKYQVKKAGCKTTLYVPNLVKTQKRAGGGQAGRQQVHSGLCWAERLELFCRKLIFEESTVTQSHSVRAPPCVPRGWSRCSSHPSGMTTVFLPKASLSQTPGESGSGWQACGGASYRWDCPLPKALSPGRGTDTTPGDTSCLGLSGRHRGGHATPWPAPPGAWGRLHWAAACLGTYLSLLSVRDMLLGLVNIKQGISLSLWISPHLYFHVCLSVYRLTCAS